MSFGRVATEITFESHGQRYLITDKGYLGMVSVYHESLESLPPTDFTRILSKMEDPYLVGFTYSIQPDYDAEGNRLDSKVFYLENLTNRITSEWKEFLTEEERGRYRLLAKRALCAWFSSKAIHGKYPGSMKVSLQASGGDQLPLKDAAGLALKIQSIEDGVAWMDKHEVDKDYQEWVIYAVRMAEKKNQISVMQQSIRVLESQRRLRSYYKHELGLAPQEKLSASIRMETTLERMTRSACSLHVSITRRSRSRSQSQ